MEAITRETFNRWAQKQNWMQIGETMNPQGRQVQFLTPAGMMVIAMIDIKGNLIGIGQPVPVGQSPLPTKSPLLPK